jgi:hypothetical protein
MWGLVALLLSSPSGTEACAACHAREAAQYQASRHARARTGPLYRANHAEEPMRWCDTCHAPAGPAEDGIGCAACHVREGVVLSAAQPTARGLEAHAMRREPGFSAEGSCEGCHQANFPVGKREPVTLSEHRMQSTIDEWRASGLPRSCVDCHLPRGDHDITGGHDVARVKKALEVALTPGPDGLRLTLTNVGAGHALPTGDPFRAFELELCADEDCEHVVTTHRFGRTIARAGDSWRIAQDFSVPAKSPAGPGVRSFDVERPAGAAFWRLSLRYVGDATAARVAPELVSNELAHGPLPSTSSAQ